MARTTLTLLDAIPSTSCDTPTRWVGSSNTRTTNEDRSIRQRF